MQRIVTKRTGHPTVNAKARRSKRAASFFIVFGALMLAGGIFMGYEAWTETTTRKLLESEGVETDATIVKHYMYNGIAPWVEYTFRDSTGPQRTAPHAQDSGMAVTRRSETVPVRYVQSNPDYSRVVAGEESTTEHDPKLMLILAPAAAVFSLLFFVAGVLRWKGLDLTFDERKFRFRIKRLDAESGGQTGDSKSAV